MAGGACLGAADQTSSTAGRRLGARFQLGLISYDGFWLTGPLLSSALKLDPASFRSNWSLFGSSDGPSCRPTFVVKECRINTGHLGCELGVGQLAEPSAGVARQLNAFTFVRGDVNRRTPLELGDPAGDSWITPVHGVARVDKTIEQEPFPRPVHDPTEGAPYNEFGAAKSLPSCLRDSIVGDARRNIYVRR
jgi:hypothetical protein